MLLRHTNITLCTFVLFTSAFVIFWLYLQLKTPPHKPPSIVTVKAVHRVIEKSPPKVRYIHSRELLFDNLMDYILHPKTTCNASVVLGGIQVGDNYEIDGDKVICLHPGPSLKKGCIVYSFGVGEDWSFEEDIHDHFDCSVFAFDPSIEKDDHRHSRGIWFYNNGIGNFDGNVRALGKTWKVATFGAIITRLGHSGRTIDVFKMDIEGGEFFILEDVLDKGLLKKVNHLCVEIHLGSVHNFQHWTKALRLLQRVEEESGLRLFSTRNNTMTPSMIVPGLPHRREQLHFELAWFRNP